MATWAQTVGRLGQVAGGGYLAAHGRDQERQSDEVGQRIAADAGYDPAGIAAFLDTLGRAEQLRTGKRREPGFFDTHPSTPERVAAARARARQLAVRPAPPVSRDRQAFLKRLDGLLVGPDPAEGIFRERRFLHPDLDLVLDFPAGWGTVNNHATVGAQHPDGIAVVQLEAQRAGSDLQAAAQEFARANGLALGNARTTQVNGMAVLRASAQTREGNPVSLQWFARGGTTFRLQALAKRSAPASVMRALDAVASSLRPLTRAERQSLRERRLRIVTARAGETIFALGQRTGNRWDARETAVANGLRNDHRFAAGEPVKIVVERAYAGR